MTEANEEKQETRFATLELPAAVRVSADGRTIQIIDPDTGVPKTLHQTLKRGTKAQGYTDYWTVSINGKNYAVHRLVAMAFIPNPDNKPMVHHIGDSLDNSADNLCWVTAEEHRALHANNGKLVRWDWEQHPKKRTHISCRIIYADGTHEDFPSRQKAAKKLKVSPATVKWRINHATVDDRGRRIIDIGEAKRARRIVAINAVTGKRRTYQSQFAASKDLGLSQGNINRCLNTKPGDAYYLSSTGGYRFIYARTRKDVA